MGGTMDGGGGSDDDGNNMPPPEDAPATTDALTAGGGSNDDDDDDDNDDDSGGSRDDDESEDDTDNDSEPIPKDAPATTDALTAKKIECPPGQEVTLFSTTCGTTGSGTDSAQGTTSAATVCPPTSPTPSSYGIPNKSITNTFHNDYEKMIEQPDDQHSLLHRVATPIKPGLNAGHAFKDPATRAVCTGEPVTVANPDGSNDVYGPDGSRTNILIDKDTGNSKVTEYTTEGKTTVESKVDKLTGKSVETVTDEDKSGRITSTEYASDTGNPTQIHKFDPVSRLSKVDYYDPNTKEPTGQKVEDFNSGTRLITSFIPGSSKPAVTSLFDMDSGLPILMIKYKEDGVTPAETIHYDKNGIPK